MAKTKAAPGLDLTADTRILKSAITTAARVAPPRSPRPATTCARLAITDGDLVVEATDLDISLQQRIPSIWAATEGAIAVPAQMLARVLDRITAPTVTLLQQGEDITLTAGGAEFVLHTIPVKDFPEFPAAPDDGKSLVIDATMLAQSLHRVGVARHRGADTRYAMESMLLAANKQGKLEAAATDGHRLALDLLDVKATGFTALVPSRAVDMLIREAGGETEAELKLSVGGGRLVVECDTWTLAAQLTESKFPPYQDVIPKDKPATRLDLNRSAFMEALRSAQLLTDEESKGVRFDIREDVINITARGQSGHASVKLDAEVSGEAMSVAFNPSYLLDPLKVLDSDAIQMDLISPNKAAQLRSGDYVHLVMPAQLG